MNALLHRTRTMLALGIVVVIAAAASLVGAPSAAACPINPDGSCISTRPGASPVIPFAKLKLGKVQMRHIRGY